MRKLSILLVVFFAATSVACSGDDGSSSADSSDGDEPARTTTTGVVPEGFLIGSVASITGFDAPSGTSQEMGTQLAASSFGLAGPRLVSVDDESTDDGAVIAVESILAANPSVIIGPTSSSAATSADPLAQQAQVPVLAATNATLDIAAVGDHVWRVSLSEGALIDQAIGGAQAAGPLSTAALISQPADDYSIGVAEAFRAGAGQHDVELLADLTYEDGDDVASLLSEAVAGGPDALLLAADGDLAGDLLRTADELDLDQRLIGSEAFMAHDLLDTSADKMEGLIVAAPWNVEGDDPASQEFVSAFKEVHDDEEPDSFAAQGYAAVQIALAAAEAGGGYTAADIQAGLADLGEIDTVLGRFSFDENREPTYPAAVQVFENGRFVLLD
jgi:branched-chain amino acid transport system substrate-binding protein